MPLDGEVGISAAAWDSTRVDLWVRKDSTSSAFKHYAFNGGGTYLGTDEWNLPGNSIGVPNAVSWGTGRLDIFYVRADTGQIGQLMYPGGFPLQYAYHDPPCSNARPRGADTTRGTASTALLTLAVACPDPSGNPAIDTPVYTRQWQGSAGWTYWGEAHHASGGGAEYAPFHHQDPGALITWGHDIPYATNYWGFMVDPTGRPVPLKGTYFFPGNTTQDVLDYKETFSPKDEFNRNWDNPAPAAGCYVGEELGGWVPAPRCVVQQMQSVGVNTVVMSYWYPDPEDPHPNCCAPTYFTEDSADRLFDASLGTGLQIVPSIEIGYYDEPSRVTYNAAYFFARPGYGRFDRAIDGVVRRYLVNPSNSAYRQKWARAVDREGRLRYAIQLVGITSSYLGTGDHAAFVAEFDRLADLIYDAYHIRIGFMVDLAGFATEFKPTPGLTHLENASSFLSVSGWHNEIVAPSSSAVPDGGSPHEDAIPFCDNNNIYATACPGGNALYPSVGGRPAMPMRDEMARRKGERLLQWVSAGLPVILDVSPGYDGRYEFSHVYDPPQKETGFWGDNAQYYDDYFRNYQSEMKGMGNVGILYNSWNSYKEGNVAVPSFRRPPVFAPYSMHFEQGPPTSTGSWDDVQLRWMQDLFSSDPRDCVHHHYVAGSSVATIYGEICKKWQGWGGHQYGGIGQLSFGTPTESPQLVWSGANPGQGGHVVHFVKNGVGSAIYHRAADTVAHGVYGAIYQKYVAKGEAGGFLGFPRTDEIGASAFCSGGQHVAFEGGWIDACPASAPAPNGGCVWAHPSSSPNQPCPGQ